MSFHAGFRLTWFSGTLLTTSIVIGIVAYLAEIVGWIPKLIGPYKVVSLMMVVGLVVALGWQIRREIKVNPVWSHDEREGQIRLVSVWVAHYVTLAALWLVLAAEMMKGLQGHGLPRWFYGVFLFSSLEFCLAWYLRGSWKP